MNKKTYVAPAIETYDVVVEQGFAQSPGGGSGFNPWIPGDGDNFD